MTSRFPASVQTAVRTALLGELRPLVLAVSGGMDSMSLLHAVHAIAPERIAAVATFDHGTGAYASQAVGMVSRVAERLKLPLVKGAMQGELDARDGREAAWRGHRHAFLSGIARDTGGVVATAHTHDDHIETVLMRVLRQSGARGLSGLDTDGEVFRPLLRVRRAALKRYARAHDIGWLDDPSNASAAFLRNRIRHHILPSLLRFRPALSDELFEISLEAAALRREIERVVQDFGARVEESALTLPVHVLHGYDVESLRLLWTAIASQVGLALDRRGIARIADFTFRAPRHGLIQLSGGWCLNVRKGVYILESDLLSNARSRVARAHASGLPG